MLKLTLRSHVLSSYLQCWQSYAVTHNYPV